MTWALTTSRRRGPALDWLLTLPAQEGLRVWLVSPKALPAVAQANDVVVSAATPAELDQIVGSHDRLDCRCQDLNIVAPLIPPVASARAGLSGDIAARLRRLYDIEAAALATAAVLLGRPDPDELAAARVQMAPGADAITTAGGATYPGPGVRPRAAARLGRAVPAAAGVGVRCRCHLPDAAPGADRR